MKPETPDGWRYPTEKELTDQERTKSTQKKIEGQIYFLFGNLEGFAVTSIINEKINLSLFLFLLLVRSF